MELKKGRVSNTDLWEYKLTFSNKEREEVVFSKWDKDLINLCVKDGTIHGILLSLYIFAKRIEEQEDAKKEKNIS